jgi:hypothetical protein
VLAFIPHRFAQSTVDVAVGYGVCALLLYGLYRFSTHLVRGGAAVSAGGAAHQSGLAAGAMPVAAPLAAPPPEVLRAVTPAAPARPTHVIYRPGTPRLVTARQRVSELTLSLTCAALCTVLITAGLAVFTSVMTDRAQIAQFGGTSLLASWLILAQAKVWEGSGADNGLRQIGMLLTGAAIGAGAWWLNQALLVEVPTADSFAAAFHRVGAHPLIEGSRNEPTLAAYLVFFVGLLGLRKWWKQADAFRAKRLAVWSVLPTALVGMALTALFAFPTVWGTVWAAAISATVQLSAAWIPPAERAAMTEAPQNV